MRTLLKDTYTDLYFIDEDSKTREEVFARISQYMQRELSLKAESVYDMLVKSRRCNIHNGIMIMEICVAKLNRPYAFILCKMSNSIDFGFADSRSIKAVLLQLNYNQTDFSQLKPISNLAGIIKNNEYRKKLFETKSDSDIVALFRLFDINKSENERIAS